MTRKFDIALSFADEDRTVATQLHQQLEDRGVRVFFDEHSQEDAWGKNLEEYLYGIYSRKAKFCIVLVSEAYKKKYWTNREFSAAQRAASRTKGEYILPVRLDEVDFPGLPSNVAFLDYAKLTSNSIAEMAVVKLRRLDARGRNRSLVLAGVVAVVAAGALVAASNTSWTGAEGTSCVDSSECSTGDGARVLVCGGVLGDFRCLLPRSCGELHASRSNLPSGAYVINPKRSDADGEFVALCDMVEKGGGWTLAISCKASSTFMGFESPSWQINDGTDIPKDYTAEDFKSKAFDRLAPWSEIRISTDLPPERDPERYDVVLQFGAQRRPLLSNFGKQSGPLVGVGRTLGHNEVAVDCSSPRKCGYCDYPVLNAEWDVVSDAGRSRTGGRIGIPIFASHIKQTEAPFPCNRNDQLLGRRAGEAAPVTVASLGYLHGHGVIPGRFARCEPDYEFPWCPAGHGVDPRIFVWLR